MPVLKWCQTKFKRELVGDFSASGTYELVGTELTAPEASTYGLANTPQYVDGMALKSLSMEQVVVGKNYKFQALWQPAPDESSSGSSGTLNATVVNGSIGTRSKQITQAIANRNIIQHPDFHDVAPDTLAINVQNGEVKGAEVDDTFFTFSVNLPIESFVSFADVHKLKLYRGKVNSLPFLGFDEGECRLISADFKTDNDSNSVDSIQLNFGVEDNIYDFELFGQTIELVRGWDFKWPMYGVTRTFDEQELVVEKVEVVALYIQQIHDYADLNGLFE